MTTIQTKHQGFTLIEMLIALVILGIVMGIALPTYQNSVVRSQRSAAQGDLLNAAQAMEKEYTLNFSYAGAAAGTNFPAQSPIDSGNKRYNLSIIGASTGVDTFLVRATPIAGTNQADDGILEINHLGQRFWDKNNDGDTTDAGEDNWNRD